MRENIAWDQVPFRDIYVTASFDRQAISGYMSHALGAAITCYQSADKFVRIELGSRQRKQLNKLTAKIKIIEHKNAPKHQCFTYRTSLMNVETGCPGRLWHS
jgi:hypothetical protein